MWARISLEKTWRVSLSIGVRITMIRWVVVVTSRHSASGVCCGITDQPVKLFGVGVKMEVGSTASVDLDLLELRPWI
jgi:hypothetical protein